MERFRRLSPQGDSFSQHFLLNLLVQPVSKMLWNLISCVRLTKTQFKKRKHVESVRAFFKKFLLERKSIGVVWWVIFYHVCVFFFYLTIYLISIIGIFCFKPPKNFKKQTSKFHEIRFSMTKSKSEKNKGFVNCLYDIQK